MKLHQFVGGLAIIFFMLVVPAILWVAVHEAEAEHYADREAVQMDCPAEDSCYPDYDGEQWWIIEGERPR